MRTARSTIKDVALAAGVTAGTVSRALRGDPRVIESTRERILGAAQSLHYRPNLQARGLQTGRTGMVGLACAGGPWMLVHPYFAPMHAGFTSEASKDGVRVLLYMPPAEAQREFEANDLQARELLDGRVDGGLIYQARNFSPEILRGLQEMGVAVVLMDADEEIPGFFQVLSNTEQRVREGLRWARELGARRAGVLGVQDGRPAHAMVEPGAEAARLPALALAHELGHDSGGDALDLAIAALMRDKPDAVIFNSGVHAAHFLGLQAQGELPQGLHLFSYGGLRSGAQPFSPGLHYLETDLWGAGRKAYLMVKEAQDRKPPRTERLAWTRRA
ncbi:MAG TPA: LacI family DNA-binding transcriptional regulator [bacterium]|jgi:DNA-binding LacI/PurR family transcriptional regulator|nr:LacI family DNA-binding transcriptional regulator [bacterium]